MWVGGVGWTQTSVYQDMVLCISEVCSWSFKDVSALSILPFHFSHYHFQFHLVKIILVFYRWIKAAGTVDYHYHFCLVTFIFALFTFIFFISSLSLSIVQNNFCLLQNDLAAGAVRSRYHFCLLPIHFFPFFTFTWTK